METERGWTERGRFTTARPRRGLVEYRIATHDVERQPIIAIRDRCTPDGISELIGTSVAALYGSTDRLGATPAGPPVVLYHAFGPAEVDAEVCLPIERAVSTTDGIVGRVLPAATVACTLHVGPYDELHWAHAVLMDWVGDHGFDMTGPVRERYLSGPDEQVAPDEYRTELEIPIVPQVAAAPA